jgi:hypothetical protein
MGSSGDTGNGCKPDDAARVRGPDAGPIWAYSGLQSGGAAQRLRRQGGSHGSCAQVVLLPGAAAQDGPDGLGSCCERLGELMVAGGERNGGVAGAASFCCETNGAPLVLHPLEGRRMAQGVASSCREKNGTAGVSSFQ